MLMQVGSLLPLLQKLLCTENYSHYRKPLRQFDGTRKVRHAQFTFWSGRRKWTAGCMTESSVNEVRESCRGRKWVRKENVFNETCLSKKDEYQLVSFLTFSNYDIIEVEMGLNIYEFIHDNSIKGNFPPEFLNTIQILYILKTNGL